jgi:hypothetical protein
METGVPYRLMVGCMHLPDVPHAKYEISNVKENILPPTPPPTHPALNVARCATFCGPLAPKQSKSNIVSTTHRQVQHWRRGEGEKKGWAPGISSWGGVWQGIQSWPREGNAGGAFRAWMAPAKPSLKVAATRTLLVETWVRRCGTPFSKSTFPIRNFVALVGNLLVTRPSRSGNCFPYFKGVVDVTF